MTVVGFYEKTGRESRKKIDRGRFFWGLIRGRKRAIKFTTALRINPWNRVAQDQRILSSAPEDRSCLTFR